VFSKQKAAIVAEQADDKVVFMVLLSLVFYLLKVGSMATLSVVVAVN
jgi:hypothetical protein